MTWRFAKALLASLSPKREDLVQEGDVEVSALYIDQVCKVIQTQSNYLALPPPSPPGVCHAYLLDLFQLRLQVLHRVGTAPRAGKPLFQLTQWTHK